MAMAEKRALVRAARRTLALSGLFAEEAPDEAGPTDSRARRAAEQAVRAAHRPGPGNHSAPPPSRSETDPDTPPSPHQQVRVQAGRLHLTASQLVDLYRATGSSVVELSRLTEDQASRVADALEHVPDGTAPDEALEMARAYLTRPTEEGD